MGKAVVLALVGALAMAASATAQAPNTTYRGTVHCVGTDRYSPGGKVVRYESDPTASAAYGPGGELQSWTYLFLGRPDLVVQSSAVRPGQRFAYSAGRHIRRPGRTVIKVVAASPTNVDATLDWKSTARDYVGSGTYRLRLTPTAAGGISYEAVKAVVKTPVGARPDRRHPVIRRLELCVGTLSP